MSRGARYKFIGSTIQVTTGVTGVSPSPAISGISQTNEAVVTTTGPHGLVQGDIGYIYGVVGATQFNSNLYPVDNVTTNTLQLGGYDNTNGDAYTSGGYIDKATLSSICELTGINRQGGGADQEDVSTVCSDAKEFEQGLSDPGTLSLDFNFAPKTTVQAQLIALEKSGAKAGFKIALPNSGGTIFLFGTVQTTSFSGQVGQAVWKGSASIKLSGAPFIL